MSAYCRVCGDLFLVSEDGEIFCIFCDLERRKRVDRPADNNRDIPVRSRIFRSKDRKN